MNKMRIEPEFDDDTGTLTIVTNEEGQCVAVTRTDSDGEVLCTLWEAPRPLPEPNALWEAPRPLPEPNALWEAPRPLPEPNTLWQHRKGTFYVVIDVTSQPEPDKADKFPRTVFYKDSIGQQWCRTLDSWYESFEPVTL
jgi:hypothetical protein